MMTQTHLLVGAASLARPGQPWRNTAAIVGAIIPDAALYLLLIFGGISGLTMEEMFRERYWSPAWQIAMSPGNSAPLFLVVLGLGYVVSRGKGNWNIAGWAIMALAASALMHIALDFPLHVDDGHTHLWPITNWKFESPVSYWDPAHYGNFVRPLEFLIGIGCCLVIFRRFPQKWVKALALFGMAAYIIEPLVFFIAFAGGS